MTPLDFEVMMGPSGLSDGGCAGRVGRWSASLSFWVVDTSFSLYAECSSCEDDSAERAILKGQKGDQGVREGNWDGSDWHGTIHRSQRYIKCWTDSSLKKSLTDRTDCGGDFGTGAWLGLLREDQSGMHITL